MIAPNVSWEEQDETTVAALQELLKCFWMAKQQVNKLKKDLDAAEKTQTEFKDKLLERMQQEGMQRFDGDECFVLVMEKKYVVTPKTKEEKQLLFLWLQKQGVYWDYVSVNYQSLQSLYKEQKEISNEENFTLPGIEPERTKIDLRAFKQKQKQK